MSLHWKKVFCWHYYHSRQSRQHWQCTGQTLYQCCMQDHFLRWNNIKKHLFNNIWRQLTDCFTNSIWIGQSHWISSISGSPSINCHRSWVWLVIGYFLFQGTAGSHTKVWNGTHWATSYRKSSKLGIESPANNISCKSLHIRQDIFKCHYCHRTSQVARTQHLQYFISLWKTIYWPTYHDKMGLTCLSESTSKQNKIHVSLPDPQTLA